MTKRDMNKALDSFLGITPGKPEKQLEPVLRQWETMRSHDALPDDLKQKGWKKIMEKNIELREGHIHADENMGQNQHQTQNKKNEGRSVWEFAAAAVVFILFSIIVFHHFPSRKKYSDKFAKILSSQSGVLVNNVAMKEGGKIRAGDILESTGESYRLRLSETVVLDVQYKSRLRFYENEGITYVDLQQGGLAAVVNSTERVNHLVFTTPTGNIVVKGTVFYARVMSPDETYFCICHGEVELITKNASKTVSSGHHGGYSMIRKNSIENIVPDTMKYHQDPLLEEMAKNLNYKIDWKR
jgi:hypothetical protein